MYRCAFLGCGPRARSQAQSYKLITRGEIVALCDLNPERLAAMGGDLGVPARYTDLDEMLRCEKPDLVHVVTPPTLRVGLMSRLAEARVPAVLVEKPIALGGDDYHALRALEASSATRFAVNHQLRHHPKVLELLADVQAGKIGQVRFLDATCQYPMSGQGVHVLDLMFAFNGCARPTSVFGACSGYTDINGTHPAPRAAEFLITFENGARAALMAGEGAPAFAEGPDWMHKRIAVYGTHGFLHWRMDAWERSLPDGEVEQGVKSYAAEDVQGEAGLVNAVFDWLEDDEKVAPTNLATSLDEWLVILAGYASAVEQRAIPFPFDPADDLLEQMKRHVGEGVKG